MNDERKKSVWPWMLALLIGLPVLYVAAFGPAVFLWHQLDHPYWIGVYLDAPDPIDWVIQYLPEPMSNRLNEGYYSYYSWWRSLAR